MAAYLITLLEEYMASETEVTLRTNIGRLTPDVIIGCITQIYSDDRQIEALRVAHTSPSGITTTEVVLFHCITRIRTTPTATNTPA